MMQIFGRLRGEPAEKDEEDEERPQEIGRNFASIWASTIGKLVAYKTVSVWDSPLLPLLPTLWNNFPS